MKSDPREDRHVAHRGHAPRTPHENFYAGLVQVHGELRQASAQILAGASAERGNHTSVNRRIRAFVEELENHHRSEDVFFFPAFRAAGRLRSTDIAFLDARDDEHVVIVRLAEELQALTERTRSNWAASVRSLITELGQVADAHFAAEEQVLTPRHLAEMITQGQLVDVYREMGQNWNRSTPYRLR
nr:hypothetical protein [Actinoallomurus sp.]